MAQEKPERMSFDDVLKLVDPLSPEEQDKLAEEMKLQWLRRELDKAEESLAKGDMLSEEEVLQRLSAKRRELLDRQSK
jgi:hypothetical protein